MLFIFLASDMTNRALFSGIGRKVAAHKFSNTDLAANPALSCSVK